MADRAPDELLSSQCLPGVSEPLMQDTNVQAPDTKVQGPKQRGRGTFSYKKHELYSDQLSDKSIINDAEDEDDACDNAEAKRDARNCKSYIFLQFKSSIPKLCNLFSLNIHIGVFVP